MLRRGGFCLQVNCLLEKKADNRCETRNKNRTKDRQAMAHVTNMQQTDTRDLPVGQASSLHHVAHDLLSIIGEGVNFALSDQDAQGNRTVTFEDGKTLPLSELDRLVPCFTPGTAIATPKGEVLVEELKVGDRVVTRDNGLKAITWIGKKRIDYQQLNALPTVRPILIERGALGNGLPEQDMLVSPSHRMLIVSELARQYFDRAEVLVAAKHMLEMEGVAISNQPYITYIPIMCENHELVLSNGAWSESFQPGDFTLKGFDTIQREELFLLFPELETTEGIAGYSAARRSLSRREAKRFFSV